MDVVAQEDGEEATNMRPSGSPARELTLQRSDQVFPASMGYGTVLADPGAVRLEHMMRASAMSAGKAEVSIGKFDILATYTYAKALLDGESDSEARTRGMVAAVMGAKAKSGHAGGSHDDYHSDKTAAEKKKKSTITAESFEHQVSQHMGEFFDKTFFPTIEKLVKKEMSYDEVKKLVKIPTTWGAKITGEQFEERVAD